MNDAAELPEPWHRPWPSDGLEMVRECPVCGAAGRVLLFADLVDTVFRVAPGKWRLWRCEGCGSAYLDPRPSPDTIHLAYSSYYTHAASPHKVEFDRLTPLRRLRRRLVNGYTRWRFSDSEEPYSYWGIPALFFLPAQRRGLDGRYRHWPKRHTAQGVLLDIGCGNGSFLQTAASCGWQVTGLDPDANAVTVCRQQGLHALHGGVELLDAMEDQFDVITMNHVIEHVPDPAALLRACHRLLRPGGRLWLQTPNIASLASRRFRSYWRGLEPPRHLVLFNMASLRSALTKAGFEQIRLCSVPSPIAWIVNASEAIQAQSAEGQGTRSSVSQRLFVMKARVAQALFPSLREFLTLVGHKGGERPDRAAT